MSCYVCTCPHHLELLSTFVAQSPAALALSGTLPLLLPVTADSMSTSANSDIYAYHVMRLLASISAFCIATPNLSVMGSTTFSSTLCPQILRTALP